MKPKILLIGGGGHCKAVIDVIEQENRYTIAGILDRPERIGEKILGYEIIGTDEDMQMFLKEIPYALVSLGQINSPDTRIALYKRLLSVGFDLPTIISPRAYVSEHASIGKGSIIMHDVLINAGASIKDNCIINTKALIEHDCIVANHCHVSTGVCLNGATTVGEKTFIGSNTVSKEGASIPDHSFIKAGSLIK